MSQHRIGPLYEKWEKKYKKEKYNIAEKQMNDWINLWVKHKGTTGERTLQEIKYWIEEYFRYRT